MYFSIPLQWSSNDASVSLYFTFFVMRNFGAVFICPQSLCTRSFGGVFVLSRWFLDFSVGVGAFVLGLSQISSFFSWKHIKLLRKY